MYQRLTLSFTLLLVLLLSACSSEDQPKTGDQPAMTGWPQQFGTSADDQAYSVATHASGAIYVSGLTQGIFPGNTGVGGPRRLSRQIRPGRHSGVDEAVRYTKERQR